MTATDEIKIRSPFVSGLWAGSTDAGRARLLTKAHAEALAEEKARNQDRTVRITRAKLYPAGGGGYRAAWRWHYSYSFDGAAPIQYGTHLASLVGTLKRKHRGIKIVRAWDA